MIRDILQFSVPNISNSVTASIEDKVSKILDLKTTDTNSNTTNSEAEINSLVHEFYYLTEDEIKIIKQS